MYPCLIQSWALNVEANIRLSNGIDEDGEEAIFYIQNKKGNLQLKSSQRLTAQKEIITISGKLLIPGDICPSMPKITGGSVECGGATYDIHKGQKNLNPDGTVNYTTLELM